MLYSAESHPALCVGDSVAAAIQKVVERGAEMADPFFSRRQYWLYKNRAADSNRLLVLYRLTVHTARCLRELNRQTAGVSAVLRATRGV